MDNGRYQPSGGLAFDGRRMRKPVVRKTVDFNHSIIHHLQSYKYRPFKKRDALQPTLDSLRQLDVTFDTVANPSECFLTKFVSAAQNKVRTATTCAAWTPDGRRILTGCQSGEFTMWNGLTFNFESIMQAHEKPVRALHWSHNEQWLLSSDDAGIIKYWQQSMNNVKAFVGHKEPIRDISFAPSDYKFCTACDDQSVSLFDFETCKEEAVMRGHGYDVRAAQWHPYKALVASGGKDSVIKFWDPRGAAEICTLNAHKNTVNKLVWNSNGNWLASGSRDQLIKIWDVRTMRELHLLKGHKREITSLAWHPWTETLLVSGGYDGSVYYWVTGEPDIQAEIDGAHDLAVTSLCWHPIGHMITSSSLDCSTKFWVRNKPGDDMTDRYNVRSLPDGPEKQEALLSLSTTSKFNPIGHGTRQPQFVSDLDHEVQGMEPSSDPSLIPGMGSGATAARSRFSRDFSGTKRPFRNDATSSDPNSSSAHYGSVSLHHSQRPSPSTHRTQPVQSHPSQAPFHPPSYQYPPHIYPQQHPQLHHQQHSQPQPQPQSQPHSHPHPPTQPFFYHGPSVYPSGHHSTPLPSPSPPPPSSSSSSAPFVSAVFSAPYRAP